MLSFLLLLDRAIELYCQDDFFLTNCYVFSDASEKGDSCPEGQVYCGGRDQSGPKSYQGPCLAQAGDCAPVGQFCHPITIRGA